jgi:hypothetical protein
MFNRQVTRHSVGKKQPTQLDMVSEAVITAKFLENVALERKNREIERAIEAAEKRKEEQKVLSSVVENSLLESRLVIVINDLNKKGRDIIFKDILFEFFYNSLLLDEPFKREQEENLRYVIESFVDKNGGYEYLKSAYQRTKSPILKAIMECCESIAGKVCTRKMCECKDKKIGIEDINFELNDEEKEELKYRKANLSIDDLADLVKDKVLTVVKDEKERKIKEEELQKELEAQAKMDGTTVEEAYRAYVLPARKGYEESTLFDSIFRNTYKIALESIMVQNSGYLHQDNYDANMDTDMIVNHEVDDVKGNEWHPYKMSDVKRGEYSVETERNEYENDSEDPLDDDSYKLDMDLILAESITKYTLMEVAFTIMLEDYNYQKIQKISQKLLN